MAKTKKRFPVGTFLFYLLLIAAVAAYCFAAHYGLGLLEDWLTKYEASQPNVRCQQIFDELFRDPDWSEIYDLAGVRDTEFEGKDAFVAYMEQKVGTGTLSYNETSAGLSGDHKYIVKLGEEKLAVFTLTAQAVSQTEIADWQLGAVEVFFERRESVTVCTAADRLVYLNGVPLDDTSIVGTVHTTAEEYLPEGLHGLRQQTVYREGFLIAPQVTVTDLQGDPIPLTQNPDTGIYHEEFPEMTISQEQMDTVTAAAKVYGEYMIKAATSTDLRKHFDPNSQIYKTVRSIERWVQDYKSYRFTEPEFSDYYRYSDTLYSVKISMSMDVTRPYGVDNVKAYPIDSTFFMTQGEDGKWLVTDVTNVDIQAQTTLVQLTWLQDGQVLHSEMVDTAAASLTPPQPEVPEGKTFAGWFRETVDEKGNTTYTLVFMPDETGTVYLSGAQLSYMQLHALFE